MTPLALVEKYGPREAMEYDLLVVGGGPAGLATAIRAKQLAAAQGKEVSVCVLEKGSEPGAHILSGAIMDPRALTELIPDWKERGAPLQQEVTQDKFLFLTAGAAHASPILPECFHNDGCYIVSLGNVVRWMSTQAEELGVEIFSGFAAAEVLFNDDGSVKGVATGNQGLGKDGEPLDSFQLGMELHARYTIFAEGSRGHLGKQLIARFQLDAGRDPQSYGIGIKELWEIDPAKHQKGLVVHSAGWPLDTQTYGGAFLYHLPDNQVTLGFITGLDYSNPWLSPFEEMQRWKTHPAIRQYLEGGKRIGYGARAITAGGILSLPRLVFPGGALVGCEAGTLNVSRIKGSHRRRPPTRRTDALPRGLPQELALRRTRQGAQLQAVVQEGPGRRDADERHRTMAAAQARLQGAAVDTAPPGCRPHVPQASGRMPSDRLPQARRQADLRPALECLHQQHQP
jgi:electron-transferring-flavoprotein dehydrogenase